MSYYFTSESVSEGHPDKIADQISDAIIDEYLAQDPSSKVACEVLVTTGQVIIAGEVKSKASVDVQKIARGVINRIGYTKGEYMFSGDSCGILNAIHEQSPDINQGVEKEDPTKQGAGDQGMMFGYASTETPNYMPMTLDLSHKILQELAEIRREGGKINYLRPDAKAQVTMRYTEAGTPLMVETVVISTQHDDFDEEGKMLETITRDMILYVIPRVLDKYPEYAKLFVGGSEGTKYHINPTGKFVIGGPHGDTGLTGRKIIVDTYGGRGAHGGGAFCFSEDTLVKVEGGYKKISLIENGDLVYTVNLESNSIELKTVREIFSKSKEDSYDLLEIELESGETIKITENHEVKTRDGWKMAKDLLEKDEILEFSDF